VEPTNNAAKYWSLITLIIHPLFLFRAHQRSTCEDLVCPEYNSGPVFRSEAQSVFTLGYLCAIDGWCGRSKGGGEVINYPGVFCQYSSPSVF
jgi:hypothetical protein